MKTGVIMVPSSEGISLTNEGRNIFKAPRKCLVNGPGCCCLHQGAVCMTSLGLCHAPGQGTGRWLCKCHRQHFFLLRRGKWGIIKTRASQLQPTFILCRKQLLFLNLACTIELQSQPSHSAEELWRSSVRWFRACGSIFVLCCVP